MLALTILGLGLVVFGALVLVKFPDRPGGKITAGATEISSVGAGMPLIVLGVLCVVIANVGLPGGLDFLKGDGASGAATPSGSAAETPGDAADCFGDFFRGIPEDRVVTLEEGAQGADIIGPHQATDEPVGTRFTVSNAPLGALRVSFFPTGDLFKVETVVDSECRGIEEYKNASRGGDKRVLQNWDTLEVSFGGRSYALTLGHDAGTIAASFHAASHWQVAENLRFSAMIPSPLNLGEPLRKKAVAFFRSLLGPWPLCTPVVVLTLVGFLVGRELRQGGAKPSLFFSQAPAFP